MVDNNYYLLKINWFYGLIKSYKTVRGEKYHLCHQMNELHRRQSTTQLHSPKSLWQPCDYLEKVLELGRILIESRSSLQRK